MKHYKVTSHFIVISTVHVTQQIYKIASMDSKISQLKETIKINEADHVKAAAEIENRYEHKLADQFERYDRYIYGHIHVQK